MRKTTVARKHLELVKPSVSFNDNDYLVDALQKLDFKRRSVVVLKYYGGYTIKEIAVLMEIPEGTVRSNLHRGLEDMKEVL